MIKHDINNVANSWNQSTFDLWEETKGSSFFATVAQHRALVEGIWLAERVCTQNKCRRCKSQIPRLLDFQRSFWNGKYPVANVNIDDIHSRKDRNVLGRSGIDSSALLAAIHAFDPEARCDDEAAGFQPCSSRALATHKFITDTFRNLYPINAGVPTGQAVAVGRYPEDEFMGGNPWFLCTAAAAELLFDARYQWDRAGVITVDDLSLPFFKDLVSDVEIGEYKADSQTYKDIMDAVKEYGDGYLRVVQAHTTDEGLMSEQFSKDDGSPVSAANLTWSCKFFSRHQMHSSLVPYYLSRPTSLGSGPLRLHFHCSMSLLTPRTRCVLYVCYQSPQKVRWSIVEGSH